MTGIFRIALGIDPSECLLLVMIVSWGVFTGWVSARCILIWMED